MTKKHRGDWLALLEAELARRRSESGEHELATQGFIDKIEQMAERLRRDPNWRELGEIEAAESAREVEAYLRTR